MNASNWLRGMDAYAKAALFGIAIFLTAALIILVTIIIVSPSDIVFGLVLLVPVSIAIVLLRYVRRWGLLVVALLSGFGIMAFLPDAGLVLGTPESFFDFLLTLCALTGLGISLVACLAGFIQYFRGAVPADVRPPFMLGLRGIAAAVAVAALASLVLTVINATDSVSASDKQGAQVLVAKDTEWDIEMLEAPAGQPIRLLLKNEDPILHTFTIKDKTRGIDIDIKMAAWGEKVVEIDPLQAGVYGFICRVEGHESDMTGAITVR